MKDIADIYEDETDRMIDEIYAEFPDLDVEEYELEEEDFHP